MEMETDNSEVEGIQSGGKDRLPSHPCNFCSASFTFELGLILHFREEHYLNRGEEEDDLFLSSDENDNDEDEAGVTSSKPKVGGGDNDRAEDSEPEGQGTAAGGELDFVTDYERALLAAEPAFNLYPELEEKDYEDDDLEEVDWEPPSEAEISWEVIVEPEHEDYDFWRGLPSSEKNGREASHGGVEAQPSSPLPKKEAKPTKDKPRHSKRILQGRTKKVISTTSIPGGAPQFRLRPLPPEKGTPPPTPKGKKDEDKVKSKVATAPAKTNNTPVPVKDRQGSRNQVDGGGHQFECIFCGKTYFKKFLFHTHLRSHTMERPYFCKLCDRSFARSNYLSGHIRHMHAGATPYKCKFCPESFSSRGGLTYHQSALHKEQMKLGQPKPIFICEACNRTFTTQAHKNSHMKYFHSKIPLRCQLCHKTYRSRGGLRKHERLMHSSESSKANVRQTET